MPYLGREIRVNLKIVISYVIAVFLFTLNKVLTIFEKSFVYYPVDYIAYYNNLGKISLRRCLGFENRFSLLWSKVKISIGKMS
jgi:hypothetical protein